MAPAKWPIVTVGACRVQFRWCLLKLKSDVRKLGEMHGNVLSDMTPAFPQASRPGTEKGLTRPRLFLSGCFFKRTIRVFGSAHIRVGVCRYEPDGALGFSIGASGTFFDVWNQLDLRVIRAKIEGGYSLPLGRVLKGARGLLPEDTGFSQAARPGVETGWTRPRLFSDRLSCLCEADWLLEMSIAVSGLPNRFRWCLLKLKSDCREPGETHGNVLSIGHPPPPGLQARH